MNYIFGDKKYTEKELNKIRNYVMSNGYFGNLFWNNYLDNYLKKIKIQERLERDPSRSKCNISPISEYISSLDSSKIDEVISNNFCNHRVLFAVKCIFEHIKNKKYIGESKEYFNNLKVVHETSEGVIIRRKDDNDKIAHDFSLIKIAYGNIPKLSLYHEYYVGSMLNKIRHTGNLHFSYTYSILECNKPYISDNKLVFGFCENTINPVPHLFTEFINPSISLEKHIEDISIEDYFIIFHQILFAIEEANLKLNFWHGNLLVKNILVRETNEKNYQTKYGKYYLKCTGKIGTIINYSHSSIKVDDNCIPVFEGKDFIPEKDEYIKIMKMMRGKSYTYGINYPLHDIYKFLMSSVVCFSKNKREDLLTEVEELVSYFHKEDVLELLANGINYDLPPIKNYIGHKPFKKFMNFALNKLKKYKLLKNYADRKVHICCISCLDNVTNEPSNFVTLNSLYENYLALRNEKSIKSMLNDFDMDSALNDFKNSAIPILPDIIRIEDSMSLKYIEEHYNTYRENIDEIASALNQYFILKTNIKIYEKICEIYMKELNIDIKRNYKNVLNDFILNVNTLVQKYGDYIKLLKYTISKFNGKMKKRLDVQESSKKLKLFSSRYNRILGMV